ncbi:hypothetical protein PT974_03629 [Cladobotryum mycophilum]|uniref:Uncharacterized protein n=1 Tax=Cladobotryum mycophilum TaxID=491253 RepID=A0ABR0SSU6_9HYPO
MPEINTATPQGINLPNIDVVSAASGLTTKRNAMIIWITTITGHTSVTVVAGLFPRKGIVRSTRQTTTGTVLLVIASSRITTTSKWYGSIMVTNGRTNIEPTSTSTLAFIEVKKYHALAVQDSSPLQPALQTISKVEAALKLAG